jgi:hypothetical protein
MKHFSQGRTMRPLREGAAPNQGSLQNAEIMVKHFDYVSQLGRCELVALVTL